MLIKSMPQEERPLEKAINGGVQALSNTVLVLVRLFRLLQAQKLRHPARPVLLLRLAIALLQKERLLYRFSQQSTRKPDICISNISRFTNCPDYWRICIIPLA